MQITAGTTAINALIAGDVDMAMTTSSAVVAAVLRDAPLSIVATSGSPAYKLLAHPAIADAAAVAVPSTEWGEAVAIAVVARPGHTVPGDDELRTLIRNRLRSSRVPERIAVVDALPYNEMGKLLRREVRAWFRNSRA